VQARIHRHPADQDVVVLVLDPAGLRVLGPVQVHTGLVQGHPVHPDLLDQPLGGGVEHGLPGGRVTAAGVGPAQREPGLLRGPLLDQGAAQVVQQHHRERPVQPAGCGVRLGDRAGAGGGTVRVDERHQLRLPSNHGGSLASCDPGGGEPAGDVLRHY